LREGDELSEFSKLSPSSFKLLLFLLEVGDLLFEIETVCRTGDEIDDKYKLLKNDGDEGTFRGEGI
jgi:hypothetical protein